MDAASVLEDLNQQQREAVLHTEGPLLVLAGAGSGKTRVIAHRIAYLIGWCGVKPWNILAVTFTNKAAEEMRSRVSSLLDVPTSPPSSWDHGPSGPFIGTFHATCVRILRQHAHLLGYRSHFAIFDESDQLALVRECLREMDIAEKSMNPQAVLSRISQAKNELISPEEYALLARDHYAERTARIYARYQEKLVASQAFDFDDLLAATVRLLQDHPAVLKSYQERWRYILVDEYQDTNHAQYRIVNLLAASHHNLCVVGDDDQSIYRWRGADIGNILSFEEDYPRCQVIRLEQNYRSTQCILEAASAVISRNLGRKGKRLWTENEKGKPPVHFLAQDEHDEAAFIARTVQSLVREEGYRYPDFAVLYRTNAQSRVIEEELRRHSLPYLIVGGVRFYDRKEIRDILAYLRLLLNPEDALALKRVINCPPRGIGAGTMDKIEDLARLHHLSLRRACELASRSEEFPARSRKALRDFCQLMRELEASASSLPVPDLIEQVWQRSGYWQELEGAGTEEAQSRMENLKELREASREFALTSGDFSLQGFLDSVALISDTDELGKETGGVSLMTLHAAKGLEFPVVFMAGMEEGVFPHAKSLLEEAEIEEERRLCYVGMTRAKHRLYLISALSRRLYGLDGHNLPSRFLQEIPEESLIRIESGQAEGKDRPQVEVLQRQESPFPAYEDFPDEAPERGLRPGLLVRHPQYGVGTIRERIGEGEGMKVTVSFPRVGVKKLSVKHAHLELV
jgi:DNA helicase-2/ATP-dependent DNA helicase PcrA